MADPDKYVPSYSFTGNPSFFPATPLNVELKNVADSIDQLVDALKDVRRSDGVLANGSVGPDQLSSALNLGFTNRGAWLAGETYSAGDGAAYADVFYAARAAHVASAANRPDVDPSIWRKLFSMASVTIPDKSLPATKLADASIGDAKVLPGSRIELSGFGQFGTVSGLAAATIPAGVSALALSGYDAVGDGGGWPAAISVPDIGELKPWQRRSNDGTRRWELLPALRVRLSQFGMSSTASGVANAAALALALSFGVPLTGEGKTYPVAGNINLPAGTDLENAGFRQTDTAVSNRKTLYANGVDNIRLSRVTVDRNGTGANGDLNSSAGIWIQGGKGHALTDVEVYGSDVGSGIVLSGATDFTLVRPFVHDIKYALATDPLDDRVQGIWISACSDFSVVEPRIRDLGGTIAGGAFNAIRSRCFPIGLGSGDFTITGGKLQRADQGLDLTGSIGTNSFTIVGMRVYDMQTWGFKAANFAREGQFVGCIAKRCGSAGFVGNPSGVVEGTTLPRFVDFVNCLALDTGVGATGRGTADPTGFLVLGNSTYPSYPRGYRFINCRAVDTQSSKTQKIGFRNEPVFGGAPANETIGCLVDGLAQGGQAFAGFHFPAVMASRVTTQQIPNGVFTAVNFDGESLDGMAMHNLGSNIDQIVIQQPGFYFVRGQAVFDADANGNRQARLTRNGNVIDGTTTGAIPTAALATFLQPFTFAYLEAGEIIRMEVYQNRGSALNIAADTRLTVFKAAPN